MNKLTKLSLQKLSHNVSQPQNMKRFYKQSTFVANPNPSHPLHKYVIKLDDKTMKTPYRHLLAVPSPILALIITSEFNRQDKHLKTGEMPMLALSRTAVDADLEGNLREHLQSTIYEYLITDTLNYYEDYYVEQYDKDARPLVKLFQNNFKMEIIPSNTLQPPKIKISQQFNKWLESLNNWQLIGFETMTTWLKSTIAAHSLIQECNIEKAERAATLEQLVQMKQNGQVEQKLMNLNQIRLMISSGLIMYQQSSEEKKIL